MARQGFNATQRAKEREEAPITLGDVEYKPARLANAAMTEVQRLTRENTSRNEAIVRETQDFKDRVADLVSGPSPMARRAAEERAMDEVVLPEEVSRNNTENVAHQLTILLVKPDGSSPTMEEMTNHVANDIDQRDLGPLLDYLVGPDSDPTDGSATPETS